MYLLLTLLIFNFSLIFSSVNDNLLEKLLKVNSQLQESKDAYIESRNHAIGDTDEVNHSLIFIFKFAL